MRIELPQLNKTIEVEKGDNLFKSLKAHNIAIASSCNGDGVCGKCVVHLKKGHLPNPNELEQKLITKYQLQEGQRISCQCEVASHIEITTTYW